MARIFNKQKNRWEGSYSEEKYVPKFGKLFKMVKSPIPKPKENKPFSEDSRPFSLVPRDSEGNLILPVYDKNGKRIK